MLTDQQLAHWRTFGFLVLREVFSGEEMGERFFSILPAPRLGSCKGQMDT